MSFISLTFFLLISVTFVLYFLIPARFRWITLLLASIVFYLAAGVEKIIFALIAVIVAYVTAKKISSIYESSDGNKAEQKKAAKPFLVTGTAVLIVMLFTFKILQNVMSDISGVIMGRTITLKMLVPLGISYYTFALIGYMADVYWRKDKAERNFFHLFLYALYFPQIIEGPIPRHKNLQSQLLEGHEFDFRRITFGCQRAVWGLFKKMVIADRAAIIVTTVLQNHLAYSGLFYLAAILASAIQLYADFSGCMDIALGISQCFGIQLEENFKRPFFSRSAAEFWRRWHITLGAWFKDYVYMPLVISPGLMKLSKKVKDRRGSRAAKNVMTVIPLLIVWILTGLWHGTGLGYIVWGLYWGAIIIISTVFAPEIKKLNDRLHVNQESVGWMRWQRIRTFLIFCGGRLLTAPGNLRISGAMVKSFFRDFNPWIFVNGEICNAGLDKQNLFCLLISVIILFFVSYHQEKGVDIREKVASYPIVLRWVVYYLLIFAIIIFGIWGPGYSSGAFMYSSY